MTATHTARLSFHAICVLQASMISLFSMLCSKSVKATASKRVSVAPNVSSGNQSQSSANAQQRKMVCSHGARNVSASTGGKDNVLGIICLDITTHNVRRSSIELCLNKQDILDIYNRVFADTCPICHAEVDPPGVVCCECCRSETQHHTDCCLAEEEEK